MIGRFRRCDAGSSLLEFALVLPVLLVLMIGLMDLGRAAYLGILAANAARAGAQYGSQNLTTALDATGMGNAVVADAPGVSWATTSQRLCSIGGGSLTSCPSSPQNVVYYVKVHVTGSFAPLVRYPGLPSTISITGDSVMRVTTQ